MFRKRDGYNFNIHDDKEAELGLLPPTLTVIQVKSIWATDFRFLK